MMRITRYDRIGCSVEVPRCEGGGCGHNTGHCATLQPARAFWGRTGVWEGQYGGCADAASSGACEQRGSTVAVLQWTTKAGAARQQASCM
eukprot:352026-Chlamydomonas_euryale.AAC.1